MEIELNNHIVSIINAISAKTTVGARGGCWEILPSTYDVIRIMNADWSVPVAVCSSVTVSTYDGADLLFPAIELCCACATTDVSKARSSPGDGGWLRILHPIFDGERVDTM